MNLRLLLLAIALVPLAAACGNPPEVIPVRNLERPSDMAFACVVRTAGDDLTGAPITACHPPGQGDPRVESRTQREFGTFGFVTNTARSEVAVVDFNRGRLGDLDRAIPGYTMVPVGQFPENLAATQDGCRVVTANRGSCDLSIIDPTKVLRDPFRLPTTSGGVERVVALAGNGEALRVAPQEIAFLPQPIDPVTSTLSAVRSAAQCRSGATWRAVVTFPACDLVALLEFPSGRIIDSVKITASGVVDTGANPTCPVQCGPGATAAGPDAGAPDDAGSVDAATADPALPANLGVGALAMLPDGNRIYVGASRGPFITALDITGDTLVAPEGDGRIPLLEGAIGTTRVRLTLNPHELGLDGYLGRWVTREAQATARKYLYAFARDGSVRVLDLTRNARGMVNERECDVNVHPDEVTARASDVGCVPAGSGLRRRPFAAGPGLRIQSSSNLDAPPPVPRDIAFAYLAETAGALEGAFGYLLASNGRVYLVNVERPAVVAAPGLLHNIRDHREVPPRLFAAPSVSFSASDVPYPVRLSVPPAAAPRIEPAISGAARNYVAFTDPRATLARSWSVTWEGALPGTDRTSATLDDAATAGTPAGAVTDLGADFCRSGVLPGDLVAMSGCIQDADCGPGKDRVCHQPTVGAAGLCVPKDQMRRDELVRRCSRFLTSRRRYEVLRSTRTTLELGPKLDEIPKTTLNGCAADKDCNADDFPPQLKDAYSCQQVRPDEPKRCVRRCTPGETTPAANLACLGGFVCESVQTTAGPQPLCLEAPAPDPVCWPQPSRYRVHAGQSFVVNAAGMPAIPTTREGPGGVCQPDLDRNPVFANRIPLRSPACSNVPPGTSVGAAQSITPRAAGGVWGNPCLFRAPDEGTASPERIKALYEGPQVRFVLTNLETYFGDVASIRFDVDGGFESSVVLVPDEVIVTLGTRILTGPTKSPESPVYLDNSASAVSYPYLYVIDQGPSPRTEGSRGQILRINPRTRSGTAQFDSLYTRDPFHIQ